MLFRLLLCCLGAAALLLPGRLCADEVTRQVQDELRKRRLYYGDLDGQQTPELGIALKRYQEHKGFPASGVADAQTLRSMGIAEPTTGATPADVPILRSDAAAQPVSVPIDNPPTAPMSITGDITVPPPSRDEVREFMRRYLAAGETENVTDELVYYAPLVDYFKSGVVPKAHVREKLAEYNELWPQRKYTMDGEVTLTKRGDHTAVTALVAYELSNPAKNRKADGRVNHTIVLGRTPASGFEIVGVQEQRPLGQSARKQTGRRSSKTKKKNTRRRMTPLDRTLQKFFNPPKSKKKRR